MKKNDHHVDTPAHMSEGGLGEGLPPSALSKKLRVSVLPSDINNAALRDMEEVQFPKSPREPRTQAYSPAYYNREASRQIGEVGAVSAEAFVVSAISDNILVSPDSPLTLS